VLLRSEIQAEEGRQQLTSAQERELERLLTTDKDGLRHLQEDQPYIVGTVTSNRVLKMKKAIEFLLKLDPNRANVLEQTLAKEERIQAYYRAQLHLMVDTHLGCKPFFDRTLTRLVDVGDCLYVHNDFVRPGRHSYFIVVPNGSGGFKYKK